MEGGETKDLLWHLVHIIDRSILPRTIEVRAPKKSIEIDASGGRMLLCPRLNGVLDADDELRRESPRMCAYLEAGVGTAGQEMPDADIAALRRQCARTLMRVAASAKTTAAISIRARRMREHVREHILLPSHSAIDIARSLAPFALCNAKGTVADYYRQVASSIDDAWLLDHSGRPIAFPQSVAHVREIRSAESIALDMQAWRELAQTLHEPVAAFATPGRGYTGMRSLAIDNHHVALLSGSAAQVGFLITVWHRARSNAQKAEHADVLAQTEGRPP